MSARVFRIVAIVVLVAIPAALSLVPGLPAGGYGQILFLLPFVYLAGRGRQWRRVLLYLLGIGLQALAYPDIDWGFLGWVLLLPYLLAREEEDGAVWWRAAFLYGFLRAIAGFYWLLHIHFYDWAATAAASGIAFVLCFEAGVRFLKFLPYAFRVGVCWVFFEWVHSWFMGGLPWLYLSHSQYRFLPFLQAADLAGAAGLSFLMAFFQGALFQALRRRGRIPLAVSGALVGAAVLYGLFRPTVRAWDHAPRVLLVQTALSESLKDTPKTYDADAAFRSIQELTLKGLRAHPETRLVVWPETIFPYPYVEGHADPYGFLRAARACAWLYQRTTHHPVAAIYGVNSYSSLKPGELRRGFNSAVLVDGSGAFRGIYRKQRLVPMGEQFLPRIFLPKRWADALFAWLHANVGYPSSSDLEAGSGFATLDAGPGLVCAPLICFEGLYPDLARGALRRGNPDLLLHLANDGWFGRSFEERQAVAIWVLRAVETRTPFLSCANGGVTCAIAPSGRITAIYDRVMEPGWLSAEVPPREPEPLYLRTRGLLLPFVLGLAVLALLVRAFLRRGRGS